MNLIRISDSTLLKSSATYQIEGYLYLFVVQDPYASIQAPRYKFRPLPGQKRRSDLVLNQKQLRSKVHEVEGMKASRNALATDASVQLSLF